MNKYKGQPNKEAGKVPQSPRGVNPLDSHTEDLMWEKGYEAASYQIAAMYRTHIDVGKLFMDEIKGRRLPREVTEIHPQYWEYLGAFTDGVKEFLKTQKGVSLREACLTQPLSLRRDYGLNQEDVSEKEASDLARRFLASHT